jgi:hypothetical protein
LEEIVTADLSAGLQQWALEDIARAEYDKNGPCDERLTTV